MPTMHTPRNENGNTVLAPDFCKVLRPDKYLSSIKEEKLDSLERCQWHD